MKSKKNNKKTKNIAGDVNESMLEPIKIFRKGERDYHSAQTKDDYLTLIKRLDDLVSK